MGQEGKGWPLQLLGLVLNGAALLSPVDQKAYGTDDQVIQLVDFLSGGRLQTGLQGKGLPMEQQ